MAVGQPDSCGTLDPDARNFETINIACHWQSDLQLNANPPKRALGKYISLCILILSSIKHNAIQFLQFTWFNEQLGERTLLVERNK